MKITAISLALVLLVTGVAVWGYVKVNTACSEVESFARDIDGATSYAEAESAADKWEKSRKLLGAFVPAQSLNSVTASFSLLENAIEVRDEGGIIEAKSQLTVCAEMIKEAESVSFSNIF